MTVALVIAGAPDAPVIGVGPAALNVKSVAKDVPPWVLVICFTSVSLGDTSVLVMAQDAAVAKGKTKLLPVNVPAEQVQAPAV